MKSDIYLQELVNKIPKDLPQAQYSTQEQIENLLFLGRKLKLIDAVEALEKFLDKH
jgi:hypothetical protein